MTDPIYMPSESAAISVVKSTRQNSKEPSRTLRDQRGQSKEFWIWGASNNLPDEIINAVNENVLLPRVIDFKKKILMSGGLVYGAVKIEKGREILEPIRNQEIDEWLEMTAAESYLDEATEDLFTFGNIFPEILLNLRREIVAIQELDASECRLEKQVIQGKEKARINHVYLSANWDMGTQPDLVKIPVIDPSFDPLGQLKAFKGHKYALPLRTLSRGVKYYQRSPIENLIESGWLDVANSIPKWKKSVMENQLSIKYHIQINEEWLRWKFSDWDDVDDDERNKRKKNLATEFMKVMKGTENAGGAHISTFKMEGGQEIVGWKIEPIKSTNFGEKSYLEDHSASSEHIMSSQGVDPTLMGVATRNGMSAGSGSDKRMALDQLILMMRPDQRKILMPLNLKARAEDWSKKYAGGDPFAFQFTNFHTATLDQMNGTNQIQNA
jgi:hypothetical protein